jgi:hypothetical protein
MDNWCTSSERTSRWVTDFQRSSPKQTMRSAKESLCVAAPAKKHLLPHHPLWLVAFGRLVFSSQASVQRDFVKTDVLDRRPDNRQATRFCGEDVDLIGALPHIAKQAFNSIRRLNVPVQG